MIQLYRVLSYPYLTQVEWEIDEVEGIPAVVPDDIRTWIYKRGGFWPVEQTSDEKFESAMLLAEQLFEIQKLGNLCQP